MKSIHILPALLFLSTLVHADGIEQEVQKQYALVFKARREGMSNPLVTTIPLPCTMDVPISVPHIPLIILTFAEHMNEVDIDALPIVERPTVEYQDVEMFGNFLRAYKVTVSQVCQQSCVVISAPVSLLDIFVVELPKADKSQTLESPILESPIRTVEVKDEIDDIVIEPGYKPENVSAVKLYLMKWGACIFYKLPESVQKLIMRD